MSNALMFDCSFCGRNLKANRAMAGKHGSCPGCGESYTVPFANVGAPKKNDSNSIPRESISNSKYCHHCGQVIAFLAEICPKCGVRQMQAPGAVGDSSPSKVTACIFAIFLGVLGADKFYLGRPMWGAFYLLINILLCWTRFVPIFFVILTSIEGLCYLAHGDRSFAQKYGRSR